MPNTYLVQVKR